MRKLLSVYLATCALLFAAWQCFATTCTGNLAEAGIWPIAFSTLQITAMCHNQFAYWGTSTSC